MISPFWSDLDLNEMGEVLFKDFGNRAVVTWNAIGTFQNEQAPLTFQLELRADGTITFSYNGISDILNLDEDLVVGFSQGGGAANPGETDFSASSSFSAGASGTVFEVFREDSEPFDLDKSSITFSPPAIAGGGAFSIAFGGLTDVLRGGAGDDTLVVADGSFRLIDGGSGVDTLQIPGPNVIANAEFVGGTVRGIERIDLSNATNKLILDRLDVLGISDTTNTLTILGGATDTLVLDAAERWVNQGTVTIGADSFTKYTLEGATVLVQIAITQTVTQAFVAAPTNLNDLDGANGFIINGIGANDQSGSAVGGGGDLNGDGFADLIIGAPFADGPTNETSTAGESYVVFGGAAVGATGSLDLSALTVTDGFTLFGIDASDRSGFSVASAGDVNGDGIADLIIGAKLADAASNLVSNAGESYIVFGKTTDFAATTTLDASFLNGTNGFQINGINLSDESGYSVSSAGDFNGDGFADLIIGARLGDGSVNAYLNSGEAYLVFGGSSVGSSGSLGLTALVGSNGFQINGARANDRAGQSVSVAGDVNGDGFTDLIIGAPYADAAGNLLTNAGEAYVIFGGATVGSATSGTFNLSGLGVGNGFVIKAPSPMTMGLFGERRGRRQWRWLRRCDHRRFPIGCRRQQFGGGLRDVRRHRRRFLGQHRSVLAHRQQRLPPRWHQRGRPDRLLRQHRRGRQRRWLRRYLDRRAGIRRHQPEQGRLRLRGVRQGVGLRRQPRSVHSRWHQLLPPRRHATL